MSVVGRGRDDVVMELLHLHIELMRKEGKVVHAEEIEELYTKYLKLYKGTYRKDASEL